MFKWLRSRTTFKDRLVVNEAKPDSYHVKLTEAEKKLYRGHGEAIAFVNKDNEIERFEYEEGLSFPEINRLYIDANSHGNAYMGMCSDYSFSIFYRFPYKHLGGYIRGST